MERVTTITIDRIAHDGAGEAIHNGKKVRVYGMLPGETGIVELRKRKGIFVGELKELIKASPARVLPHESHFLSCSPWQIATYPWQAAQKFALLQELYGYYDDLPKPSFVPAEQLSRYRTKIEYSVTEADGKLALAFHERGRWGKFVPLPDGCMLASDQMNRAAIDTLKALERARYMGTEIKSIIVRESKTNGGVLACIYVTTRERKELHLEGIGVTGMVLVYSDPLSPASLASEVLERYGIETLAETLDGVHFEYLWDGFFQNNIPMFAHALMEIKEHIDPMDNVLDLYGGVGTIGISIARKAKQVVGAEISDSMAAFAQLNAHKNCISNYHSIAHPAERLPDGLLGKDTVLIVDPPHAGLHPKLIQAILGSTPKKIIYLSCNPETQARDYSTLREHYEVEFIRGYDFYPYTPHLESLLVLSLRA